MERGQLCKSETNRKLCGVCGGLGEYFNVDPTIIRLAFAGFTLLYGGGLWIYLIAALVLPGKVSCGKYRRNRQEKGRMAYAVLLFSLVCGIRQRGPHALQRTPFYFKLSSRKTNNISEVKK